MRKLVWFTMGFGAACLVGTWFAPGLYALLLAAAALVFCGAFFLFSPKHVIFRIGSCMALGVAVGLVWFCLYDGILLQPARLADGTKREISLLVTDYPEKTDYGISVDGTAEIGGRHYRCRLYLVKPKQTPKPGQRVQVQAKLRLTTDGGIYAPTYHRSNGMFLLAYGQGEGRITPGKANLLTLSGELRHGITELLERTFPQDAVGFIKALLLGDKSGLSYSQRNELSLGGVSHVAAVSGLHLSAVFALLYLLTFRRRLPTVLLGIPGIVFFAAVTGFSPSVCRAGIMIGTALAARLLRRDYDLPAALAFAALTLMVLNPTVCAGVGFQMSVGAVAGIFLFGGKLARFLKGRIPQGKIYSGILNFLASTVAVSIGASVFTAPISAMAFGGLSLLAPVGNVLVLWAVTLIFYGAIFACVCAGIWMPLGMGMGKVVGLLVQYVLTVCKCLGKIPFGTVYPEFNLYIKLWVVFALVLLTAFALNQYRKPGIFLFSLCLGLFAAMIFPVLEPLTEPFRVTVLDVGQGQCIILQGRGRTFLVDCGGDGKDQPGEMAARYLLTQGVGRVDGVILTHYDDDHICGTEQFLSRIHTEALYLPFHPEDESCQRLSAAARETVFVTEDLLISWDDTELRIFAPLTDGASNESGLSVLFTAGKYDTLITGDMNASTEELLLASHSLPSGELLLAGHHGSKYSTGEALLTAFEPDVLAISVGENSYGHPAEVVLERAADMQIPVVRTDREGTIIFRGR